MIFVGDYAPGASIVNIGLDTELLVLNLEGPITNGKPPQHLVLESEVAKVGPILNSIQWPKHRGKILYNLANNHFMDLGHEVAYSNVLAIREQGNMYTGLVEETQHSFLRLETFVHQGVKVGILSATENQNYSELSRWPAVRALDSKFFGDIVEASKQCEYLVVLFHGGAEDYPVPLEFYVELYREFVRLGASLVIGTHPHVPQGFEQFQSGHIFYGLGNFAVDPEVWQLEKEPNFFLTSLAVEVTFHSGVVKVNWFPLQQSSSKKGESNISRVELGENLTKYFDLCNEFLEDQRLRTEFWKSEAPKLFQSHGAPMLVEFYEFPSTRKSMLGMLRKLLRKDENLGPTHPLPNRESLRSRHILTCESHVEVAKIALSQSAIDSGHKGKNNDSKIDELKTYL